MENNRELEFMKRVLSALNLRVHIWPDDSGDIDSFDLGIRHYVDPCQDYRSYIADYAERTGEKTLYWIIDGFGFNYILFKEPMDGRVFMLIGPFTLQRPSNGSVLEKAELYRIPRSRLDGFHAIYELLPVVKDRDALMALIVTYLDGIWGKDSYLIKEMRTQSEKLSVGNAAGDGPLDLDRVERRYRSENLLMDAVSRGDGDTVSMMVRRFDFGELEKRTSDPVRNIKNHAVIMNTLLRKAAEKGEVHPVWLDRVSDSFARMIEGERTWDGVVRILTEMPGAYALLVRKEALGEKSPIIRKVLIMTAEHIGSSITLSEIAGKVGVTPSYLSRLFRKEMGMTLTDWIRKEKTKHAEQLLLHTDLRIETVAELTGFEDVSYFSRVYRKVRGESPSEARKRGYVRSL